MWEVFAPSLSLLKKLLLSDVNGIWGQGQWELQFVDYLVPNLGEQEQSLKARSGVEEASLDWGSGACAALF